MGKEKLIKRLRWYYPLEKLHTFFTFPLLAIYFLTQHPFVKSIWFLYGMMVCIFILYQGQKYWQLKLWRLVGKPFSQVKNLKFFKKAKRINFLLIMGMPVILVVQLLIVNWSVADFEILLWSFAANLFAILEHINYYHTQLMIDNTSDIAFIFRNKKLKTASLAKDLKENRF
ncbi:MULTISPECIES: hypothetical protein [Aequorivita]|uniref:General stress protein n=1 Tax=Aequorivita iocasae TaxID=2803865 RepID=A0ABX7DSU9_9FLAO|nr:MULTISPECIES: hypothetical protein [Aequorivita]QQX76822.1 hypothetical protein JK629_00675 [Aequorivita iocasae]UCA56294.1 hypothetical protein LDL78_00680 [Aequorivita sp. F7]